MITYKNIGIQSARLGNQMSQYAAVLGIANKLKTNYAIPYKNFDANGQMFNLDPNVQNWIRVNFRVPEGFEITAPNLTPELESKIEHLYEEGKTGKIGFDSDVFNLPPNTDLDGYFQCEKYWEHIEDIIKKEFTFKEEFRSEAESQIASIREKYDELVSLHFRRGDYVGNQNRHPLLSLSYYQKAIDQLITDSTALLIFSDDVNWCKEQFGEDERIYYIDGNIDFVDMCMMSLCDHNVIANSTFSWWGAWLNSNPDKKVIAPKTWLGPEIRHLQSDDLYCKNWIII